MTKNKKAIFGWHRKDGKGSFNTGPIDAALAHKLMELQSVHSDCEVYIEPVEPVEQVDMMGSVVEFHKKFGLEYEGPPRLLDWEEHQFATTCLKEEIEEYDNAEWHGNLSESLDALVDLVYFALGRAYRQGFTAEIFGEAFARVHKANMAKMRAKSDAESKRGSSIDVVKPEGWKAPDHSDLVG